MKKNKFMRLASCLLVGTLLTTCAISGTFAKYTTQDAAEDSARVAKWGVELQVIGSLYSDSYKDLPVVSAADTDATISVQADNRAESVDGDNVVAPGTKSEDNAFSFKLNGKPEVDNLIKATIKAQNIFLAAGSYGIMVKVDVPVTAENFDDLGEMYTLESGIYKKAASYSNTTFYTLEDAVDNGSTYYPVVYKWSDDLTQTDRLDSIHNIAKAIAARINADYTTENIMDNGVDTTGKIYTVTSALNNTNKNLADYNLSNETIGWSWNFTDTDNTDGDNADVDDKLDTILGNLQAGNVTVVKSVEGGYSTLTEYTDYCLDTQFSIDITVTQQD